MIAIALLSLLPSPQPLTREVAVLELNSIRTWDGSQKRYWLWWDWQETEHGWGYHVCDWRPFASVPRPFAGVQEWYDDGLKRNVRVRHQRFRETTTEYDREVADREMLPDYKRRKLGQ